MPFWCSQVKETGKKNRRIVLTKNNTMASPTVHKDEIKFFLKREPEEGKRNNVTMELSDDFLDALDGPTLELVLKTYTKSVIQKLDKETKTNIKFNDKYKSWKEENLEKGKEVSKNMIIDFIVEAVPEIKSSPSLACAFLKRKALFLGFKKGSGIKVSEVIEGDSLKAWWEEKEDEESDEEPPIDSSSEEEDVQPAKKKIRTFTGLGDIDISCITGVEKNDEDDFSSFSGYNPCMDEKDQSSSSGETMGTIDK